MFPDPPNFPEAQKEACEKSGDYCPIMFEWYKYTAIVTNLVACIDLSSPAVRQLATPHYGALIGLLNRCCRLMLSNVALAHEGRFGETTALVDRCIFESAVKVQWLCKQDSDESFRRYFAEGLKTELELKSEIEREIATRGNQTLAIETRMLESIGRYVATSQMSEAEIAASKKLPDCASMIQGLGQGRLAYVVGQRIGSHHVHGTWPSLLMHYLDWNEEGVFHPRDHNCRTHINQLVFVPLMVLGAAKAFCAWLMNDTDAKPLVDLLQSIEDEILTVNTEVAGADFSVTGT